jgi:hypothetical protein
MSETTIAAVAAALNARNEIQAQILKWETDVKWHSERIARSQKRIAALQAKLPAAVQAYDAALKEAAAPAAPAAPAKK